MARINRLALNNDLLKLCIHKSLFTPLSYNNYNNFFFYKMENSTNNTDWHCLYYFSKTE